MAMAYWGLSANLMSLGGLAIAIGMMVDGSVVMMENIFKHLSQPGSNHSYVEHMDKNEDNNNILSAIVNTVDLTRNNLADHPKLGIRDEIAVVRAVLAEISSIYGSMYE